MDDSELEPATKVDVGRLDAKGDALDAKIDALGGKRSTAELI